MRNIKVVKVLFSLLAFYLVFFASKKFGLGMSPDSVAYLLASEKLATGNGFVYYGNEAVTSWPPLYPLLLSLAKLLNIDFQLVGKIINASAFALTSYLFLNIVESVHKSLITIFLSGLIIVSSTALISTSTMLWSEPVFNLIITLNIYLLINFLKTRSWKTLIFLALVSALAPLQRYIGTTVIISTVFSIFFFLNKTTLKNKIIYCTAYGSVASTPIAILFLRNYLVSGTTTGDRFPSDIPLSENISRTLATFKEWGHTDFSIFTTLALILILIVSAMVFFKLFAEKKSKKGLMSGDAKMVLIATAPFVFIFSTFLITSATNYAFDPIGTRLLSPIYVPLLLMIIVPIFLSTEFFQKVFNKKHIQMVVSISVAIWLIAPISASYANIRKLNHDGINGFNNPKAQNMESSMWIKNNMNEEDIIISNHSPTTYMTTKNSSPVWPYSGDKNLEKFINSINFDNNNYLLWYKFRKQGLSMPLSTLEQYFVIEQVKEFPEALLMKIEKPVSTAPTAVR